MNANDIIENLVVDASADPLNPIKNFDIAVEYEKLGQTASAVSFFLRAAEYGFETHSMITYASLIKISLCIEDQNDRNLTVSNVLLQAMAYLPDRPEAYFLYSKFHEKSKNWQEAYTFAKIGLSNVNQISIIPNIGYYGEYGLKFQIATAGWWIGRREESISILNELKNKKDISAEYLSAINYNLERIS